MADRKDASPDPTMQPKPDDYRPGEMDTTEQEKTFDGFVTFSKWVIIVIIGILVFLAIFRT